MSRALLPPSGIVGRRWWFVFAIALILVGAALLLRPQAFPDTLWLEFREWRGPELEGEPPDRPAGEVHRAGGDPRELLLEGVSGLIHETPGGRIVEPGAELIFGLGLPPPGGPRSGSMLRMPSAPARWFGRWLSWAGEPAVAQYAQTGRSRWIGESVWLEYGRAPSGD